MISCVFQVQITELPWRPVLPDILAGFEGAKSWPGWEGREEGEGKGGEGNSKMRYVRSFSTFILHAKFVATAL